MRGNGDRRLIEPFSKDVSLADAFEWLFENASDAIYILDMHGNFVAVNHKAEKLTGLKREDWIGKSFRKIIPAKSLPEAIKGFLTVIRGKPITLELELKTASKKTVLVEVTSTPLITDGKIVGALGIARGITERRQMEEALKESKEQARRLFEFQNKVIDTAVVWIDLLDEEGNVTLWNRAAELISGYSREEVVGHKKIWELLYPDPKYRAEIFSRARKIIKEKRAENFETTIKCKDGKFKTISWHTNSILDEKGNPVGSIAIGIDITERKRVEKAIKEIQQKFEGLFMDNPEAATYVDSDFHIVDANPRFSELFGYAEDEIKGKRLLELIVPEDKKEEGEMLDKKALKGYVHYDTVRKRKDGTLVPVSISDAPIRVEGKIIGTVALYSDITERKSFEEGLSALNTYSRNLNMAKSMKEIYELVLDAAEKTLGFEFADILVIEGKMLCLVTHRGPSKNLSLKLPLDGDKGITVRTARTGKPVFVPDISKEKAYVEGGEEMRSELAVPIKIGNRVLGVLNVESKKLDAFNEKDQKLLEILASHAATAMSNLEHAKNLEAYAREIRESQEKFERLFMDNPEAAVYTDSDLHILDINPRFTEFFGYSFDEVKGKHIDDVVVPKDKMEEAKILGKKFTKGYAYYDTVRKRKDGTLVPVSMSGAPIRVEGKIIGTVALYKDITERRQMEKKLEEYSQHLEELVEERTRQLKEAQEQLLKSERLATIGKIAAMVGHDLRNPLTGIGGATYYLKTKLGSKMDNKIREMLELIEKDIRHSNKIISDLLDYSRERRLELAKTTPNLIIKDALTLVKVPKNTRILDLTENKPKIKIDIEKMKRIFVNIIKNAIEAMPKGGKVTIKSKKLDGSVEIAITDAGTGIPKDVMKKIWNPLFTTKAKGMGLGLSICKRIIEAHGGNISVKSKVGKGTTFTITIPIKPKLEGGEKVWVKTPESLLSTTTSKA